MFTNKNIYLGIIYGGSGERGKLNVSQVSVSHD